MTDAPAAQRPLRIALASYRSKPHSGGQGIYVRNLSRELLALGHEVTVFSGPPYPELDAGVALERLPSLELYRDEDPFRTPGIREFQSGTDLLEFATMCTSGFPEPRTFGIRLEHLLRDRIGDFDVLHDNQTLAPGLLRLRDRGLPLLTTIHHPISRDRRLELEAARGWDRVTKRRWYGFVAMQRRVARRLEHVLTVSAQSAADITADFGVDPARMTIVPVGVDVDTFAPIGERPADPGTGSIRAPRPVAKVPGRLVAVASADVPLKGLGVLIKAVRLLPPDAWFDLQVIGRPTRQTRTQLAAAGLSDRVCFRSGLTDAQLAELIGSADVHVVPSLYEGFSLPAVEAMACGTAVVASRVGALPDLLAGGAGVLVEPGDPAALADALREVLRDDDLRVRAAAIGRQRAVATYSWRAVAEQTAQLYRRVVADARSQEAPC